jgi:hypothetical protein
MAVIIDKVSGEEIVIYFRAKTADFFAEYGNEKKTSTGMEEVKTWAEQILQSSRNMTWAPVIIVEKFQQPTSYNLVLSIAASRQFYSLRSDGSLRMTRWPDVRESLHSRELSLDEALAKLAELSRDSFAGYWRSEWGAFQPPCATKNSTYGSAVYYLPYSEERWTALHNLQKALIAQGRMIKNLISTEAGSTMLHDAGESVPKALALFCPSPDDLQGGANA